MSIRGHIRLFICALATVLVIAGLSQSMTPAWADEGDTWSSADARRTSPSVQTIPEDTTTSSGVLNVSIAELDEADSFLDGQYVQIVGEVIGDRIYAENNSDYCWLTIEARDNSDAEVSTYIELEATDLIDTYGNYGAQGTILQIEGTFNLACSEHEGLSDLHAERITVLSEGSVRSDEFNTTLLIPAVILVVVGLLLIIIFYRMRENRR